jgi:Zn ribbon nucleic-acid-binding protein
MFWEKTNIQSLASAKVGYHSGRWDNMVGKHLKAARYSLNIFGVPDNLQG